MKSVLRRNNVTVSGNGTVPMIFAHGFGCNQDVWKQVAPAFEADFKVILFDYVGAGNSDLSAYDSIKYSTLAGYAQDILDICDELQLQDVILVGHSVSCMIGAIAATQEPFLFNKLVFVSPSPFYFRDMEYDGGLSKEEVDGLFKIMENNYIGWTSMMAPLIMGNSDRPELSESLAQTFCAVNPKIAQEFARVTFYSDSRDLLPNLSVDSLTIQCDQDLLAPQDVGEYIETHTPHNTLVKLLATGHCPHLSAPHETVEVIKAFLSDHVSANYAEYALLEQSL